MAKKKKYEPTMIERYAVCVSIEQIIESLEKMIEEKRELPGTKYMIYLLRDLYAEVQQGIFSEFTGIIKGLQEAMKDED